MGWKPMTRSLLVGRVDDALAAIPDESSDRAALARLPGKCMAPTSLRFWGCGTRGMGFQPMHWTTIGAGPFCRGFR